MTFIRDEESVTSDCDYLNGFMFQHFQECKIIVSRHVGIILPSQAENAFFRLKQCNIVYEKSYFVGQQARRMTIITEVNRDDQKRIKQSDAVKIDNAITHAIDKNHVGITSYRV